jgi:hypothetical protein
MLGTTARSILGRLAIENPLVKLQRGLAWADPELEAFQVLGLVPLSCRGCGCTEFAPCIGRRPSGQSVACSWVRFRWCSACDQVSRGRGERVGGVL